MEPWVAFNKPINSKSTISNSNNNSTITQTAYKNENSTTQAVNKVKDAVVSVITYSANRQNSVFGNDDTDTDSQQISSEGSGVIYKKNDKEAYIVTNKSRYKWRQQSRYSFVRWN